MQIRTCILLAAALVSCFATRPGNADPLLTSGIGLATCGKLGPDLKPGGGLDHLPNALLFYWTQGYVSAANLLLLNTSSAYVDIAKITEPAVTARVVEFCKANPDKKPISAIDQLIRETDKVAAKQSDAFNPWEGKTASAMVATPASADDAKWGSINA